MQALQELVSRLICDKNISSKHDNYALLLELFLTIEDGQSKDIILSDALTEFQGFASTLMMDDLMNTDRHDCNVTILEIIALCFSNVDRWETKSMRCLVTMLSTVCQIILKEFSCSLVRKSKEEEKILTALFALDHSMPVLTAELGQVLMAVFNKVLQPGNGHKLTRIYTYRALITFLRDSLSSSRSREGIISAIEISFMQDLTHSDVDVRSLALLFLETLPVNYVKKLPAYSDESMRSVLSFLSKDFLREQIQKEVLVAAGTWRVLVSALPGELIIPLLRDGSRDRNTPGVLLRPFHKIYSASLLEGMKCWRCLVAALNCIPGWVNSDKSENVKTLKLISKCLSSTVVNSKGRLLFYDPALKSAKSLSEYREDTAIVECIIDTLHLLVQASWPTPEKLLSFNFSSNSEAPDYTSSTSSPHTVGELLGMLERERWTDKKVPTRDLCCSFPSGCAAWRSRDGRVITDPPSVTRDTCTASVCEVLHPYVQLCRHISLTVGSATCVTASLMRSRVASLIDSQRQHRSKCSEPFSRLPLVSLFEWVWAQKSTESTEEGEEKITPPSSGEGLALSPCTLLFLFNNCTSTMETLGALYQQVYLSFREQKGTCSRACSLSHLTKNNHDLSHSSSHPTSTPGDGDDASAAGAAHMWCPLQEEVIGSILSYIESAFRDVIGVWQWATYAYVTRLAKGGRLESVQESQSQSQSQSQSYSLRHSQAGIGSQMLSGVSEGGSFSGIQEKDEDPHEISFTLNNQGDEEPMVVSHDEDISGLVREVLKSLIQVWKTVWSRFIGNSLPLCRELLLDSFLWLVHKTSTFNIPLHQEERSENTSPTTALRGVSDAVDGAFAAPLLPHNMISAVLLLSLSHGLLVGTALSSELQSVTRNCDSACMLKVCQDSLRERDAKSDLKSGDISALVVFRDRGYLCTGREVQSNGRRELASLLVFDDDCNHRSVGVETCDEVEDCAILNRGFSRCFRGLIETFSLPGLAPWLSHVLYSEPFAKKGNSGNESCSRSGKTFGNESSPLPAPSEGGIGAHVERKLHRPGPQSLKDEPPIKHCLAILGAFVSAGIHYLAAWKGNDDNCPPELRRKIANLVGPFLTFPLTWLQLFSSHQSHLLVNSYARQRPVEEELRKDDNTERCTFPSSEVVSDQSHSLTDSIQPAPLRRSLSMNTRSDVSQHSSQAKAKDLHLAEGDGLCDVKVETSAGTLDIDTALDTHEKLLTDWKYLFFVWLSLIDSGSGLIGFIHSTNSSGIWNKEMSSSKLLFSGSPPQDFQLDRFVIDTYVSFSFLNCVYECITQAEASADCRELRPESGIKDCGVLFGRDRQHRREVVLTTPTKRLLLQEVSIRFVNIFCSWSCTVLALLLPVPAVQRNTSGLTRHALNADFRMSATPTTPSGHDQEDGDGAALQHVLSNTETCCAVLQGEDVFLWVDYIFTLRETLRHLKIQIVTSTAVRGRVENNGGDVSISGMPLSSVPADSHSSDHPMFRGGSSSTHQGKPSDRYSSSNPSKDEANGLVLCLEWCFDIILQLKRTQLSFQSSHSTHQGCIEASSLLNQKVTLLVKHVFEKLFHYMYDFNCRDYLELLNGSIQSFVKSFTQMSLELVELKPLVTDSDVNIETVHQFICEWNEKYMEVVQDIKSARASKSRDDACRASPSIVVVSDLTTPSTPPSSTPPSSRVCAGEGEGETVTQDAQVHEAREKVKGGVSMIDALIGDDLDLQSFPEKEREDEAEEHTKSVHSNSEAQSHVIDELFEYDVKTGGEIALASRSTAAAIASSVIVPTSTTAPTATPAVAAPEILSSLCTETVKKRNISSTDTTAHGIQSALRKVPRIEGQGPGSSPSALLGRAPSLLLALKKASAMLQHADSLVASIEDAARGEATDWNGGGKEEQQLLGETALLSVQLTERLLKIRHGADVTK